MSIFKQFDNSKGTVVLTYGGKPLTPDLKINDPKQLLDELSKVIDDAYNELRDAGLA
ncbi:MAG TPA: hypothetical protein VFF64_16150 [Candidatus Eremiobacteraceae bacterium]|nr:hypothetical protein [Candidatus Eremiobacteraceae bacterium]